MKLEFTLDMGYFNLSSNVFRHYNTLIFNIKDLNFH